MNTLVVERFFPGRSLRIHNLTLTESTPDSAVTTSIANRKELATVVEQTCGIRAGVVRQAIDGLDLDGDIYT